MIMDAGYAIWGGALAALVTLLLVVFASRGIRHLKQVYDVYCSTVPDPPAHAEGIGDAEHRALMYMMQQKTDSMLVELSRTIQRERQKLGVNVRNPSISDETGSNSGPAPGRSVPRQAVYAQVLPLAQNGTSVAAIARQLALSEAEVSLIVRLDAA